jgi:hypothetical protein
MGELDRDLLPIEPPDLVMALVVPMDTKSRSSGVSPATRDEDACNGRPPLHDATRGQLSRRG